MKVQLIQPSTGPYRSNSRSGCYAPLGLISIATHLHREAPEVEVEVLDAELLGQDGVIRRLDADYVGINANTVTYPQAIEVARHAKEQGSQVALGGVFPSALAELVLERRSGLVDCLVVGSGEGPFLDFVEGRARGLASNPLPQLDLVPIPDRSLIDLDAYLDRFSELHPSWKFRGTNIFTNVGCYWRDGKNPGCLFCSRSGGLASTREPHLIWREVQGLVESYGVDYLVDFSDTILQHGEWLQSLVEAKPKESGLPIWHVFARVDEVNPRSLDLLARLPCRHIFVGIESGDPALYRRTVKGGGSPREALRMAELLSSRQVALTPSYVLGLPGETESSLQTTYDHARRLQDILAFDEVFCCPLIPFPGSPAFEMLRARVPIETDILDIEELQRLWVELFCEVSLTTVKEYADKILDLGRYRITIAKTPELESPSPALIGAGTQAGQDTVYTCS